MPTTNIYFDVIEYILIVLLIILAYKFSSYLHQYIKEVESNHRDILTIITLVLIIAALLFKAILRTIALIMAEKQGYGIMEYLKVKGYRD